MTAPPVSPPLCNQCGGPAERTKGHSLRWNRTCGSPECKLAVRELAGVNGGKPKPGGGSPVEILEWPDGRLAHQLSLLSEREAALLTPERRAIRTAILLQAPRHRT